MSKTTGELAASNDARAAFGALETVGSSLDLGRTVDHVLSGLKSVCSYDRASAFVKPRNGTDALICHRSRMTCEAAHEGAKISLDDALVGRVLRSGRASSWSIDVDERVSDLKDATRSAMVAPIIGGGGRILGAVVVESFAAAHYEESGLGVLMSYTRAVSPSIERALLYRELMSDRRVTGELEVARQVMASLLPRNAPRLEGFDIAAVIESAYEVGGDYYDFIPLGNDRWGFAMADVSGKGAPAALVVAAMRATLYTLARRELALRAILKRANEFVHSATGPGAKYVTLFYAVLDIEARRFIYINAGHLPPIVLRKKGNVELLRSGGFPLGFFDNPRYFEQFVQLETGDLVCLYTDGITEATNANDEEYTRDRLVKFLETHRSEAATDLCRAVLSDVRHHSGGAPADDATVLIVRAI